MRSAIRLVHLRQLRRQPLRTLLAVIAVAAGVSLGVAVIVVSQSVTASVARFEGRLAGPAPLRIVGTTYRGALPDGLLNRIQATPGVASAAPSVEAVTLAERPGTTHAVVAVGVDCSIESFVGHIGCDQSQVASATDTSAPFISNQLQRSFGVDGVVRTDIGGISLRDAPVLPALDRVNNGWVVVFPLPEAQRVFLRPGRLDAIYVQPARGVATAALATRLAGIVGGNNQVVGARTTLPGRDTAGFILPLLALISLAALAVGGLLVYNVMALSVEERRRELAISAAIGASPRTIGVGMLAEATLYGLSGGLLGALVGAVAARPLLGTISAETQRTYGVVLFERVAVSTVGFGVVLGVALAAASAWRPAARAVRIDIASELHERGPRVVAPTAFGIRRALILTGLALTALAGCWLAQRDGGLHGWQPALGEASVVILTVTSVASVAGWATLIFVGLARATARRASPTGLRIAMTNLARFPTRTGTMATAVAAAVALAGGLANFLPAERAGVARSYGTLAEGRVFVSNLEINNSASIDAKLSPTTLAALRAMPGVASVDPDFYLVAHTATSSVAVTAYTGFHGGYRIIEGGTADTVLAQGDAVVGPGLARVHNLHPGGFLKVPTPAGPVALRVGAIWENADDQGNTATVAPAVLTRLWGPQPPTSVFVRPAPGVDAAQLALRIQGAGLDPDIRAYAPATYTAELAREVARYITPFWALQRILLLVAFIATIATLLLVAAQRRQEHAVLNAIGMRPMSLTRLTLIESGAVGTVGSLLGLAVSVVFTVGLVEVAGIFFGLKPPLRFDPAPGLLYALIGTLTVCAGTLWPAWQTTRLNLAEAIRYE